MRQKFIIENNGTATELNIKEYANLDRENRSNLKETDQEFFSLLCEETYDNELITSAIKKGKKSLISVIRTRNMYPILIHAEKIADSIIELYASGNNLPFELLMDDKELLEIAAPTKKSKSSL